MKTWTYRRRFTVDGTPVSVITEAGLTWTRTHLEIGGIRVATDIAPMQSDGLRPMKVSGTLPDGRTLTAHAGFHSWLNVGMKAEVDGRLVWESHPGKPIALPKGVEAMVEMQMGEKGQIARLKSQRWAVSADIALAILFFLVAKFADLRTAALVAAAAGLALVVVQRFVPVDLLGGLALFGIALTLLGAGFAILFEDERMIQLRSTVLGTITAGMFLTDAAFGGRYLGKRLALYLPVSNADPRRFALGMGFGGLLLAATNWAVVEAFTKDQWLFYTTFLDTPLAIGLLFAAMHFARPPAPTPA